MPEAPKIFISASTPDLRSVRQAACDAIHAVGCQPVVAEHGEADSGAFWQSLQPVLRECRAIVHVVGWAYGDEPQRRQPAEHRRSYAQLEYDLAVALRRPLSIIVCTERFPFDSYPLEEAEKQRLQQTHRTFVQGGGRPFQFVESHAELLSALGALRVPGMAPIVPILTPLPNVRPAPAAPAPALASQTLQWMSHAPRRRLFRWVAAGLAACILVLMVSVVVLAWMLWTREQPVAATPAAAPLPATTPPAIARAAPPNSVAVVPRPPIRQSSPVPLAVPPTPQTTPASEIAHAPSAVSPPPPPPAAVVKSPPAAAGHTPANVPHSVLADRSPIDPMTRKAIVDRITLAPDIPPEKKEKVREIVTRAREMRRVLVLPFGSGQSQLDTADATTMKDLVHAPEFAAYREDPTYAFIVLGFADTRGADDYNLRLSTDRARNVRDLLRRDSSLPNIIHPVGLGKTTLLDEQQLEKNRIVEVWVIRL